MRTGLDRGRRAGAVASLTAWALLLAAAPQTVPREVAAAFADADPDVREEAILGLRGRPSQAELALLRQALEDVAARVRRAAIERLADIGDSQAVASLAFALTDPEATVREDVVYALARIRSRAAMLVIERALGDPDEGVREAAADVLEELPGEPRRIVDAPPLIRYD